MHIVPCQKKAAYCLGVTIKMGFVVAMAVCHTPSGFAKLGR